MKYLVMVLLVSSCSFIKRKGEWGQNAFKLRASTIGRAFINNISDPHVWVPTLGAGVLSLSKQDQKISDWASKYTPVNGSKAEAHDTSNRLLKAQQYSTYATLLTTKSWDENFVEYAFNKVKGGVVMSITTTTSHSVTNNLKHKFKRERPNGGDHKSLPSGHSAKSATLGLINRRNLAYSDLNPVVHKTALVMNSTLTAAIMWARVEAKMHYTSDVLAGYALGQFVGGFVYDSLMNLDPNETFAVYPNTNGSVTALYTMGF